MNNHPRVWSLQDAKARFSEVVRRAQSEGPQTVTVRGEPAVVISAASNRVAGEFEPTGTGLDLLRAMQSCPYPEIFDEIEKLRVREPMIVKDHDFT